MSFAVAIENRTALLEAADLAHHYAPGRGLEPVSFTVHAPGAVAVTGPNGSGKSTLLRIVAGLVRPSRGALRLSVGETLVPPDARRTHIGFASPDLMFYDELTVTENLAFAGEALGLAGATARVGETLARVGLEPRAGDPVSTLSSGMKQRLRLAFALLSQAPVLLLDEPGSHLDDEGRALVADAVQAQGRVGLVVIATNDEREWRLVDQRIELRGRGFAGR